MKTLVNRGLWRFCRLLASLMFVCDGLASAAERASPAGFQAELEQLAQRSGLNVGFAIQDLSSGETFVLNENTVFAQGSTIRIHLVAELFRQHAAKKLSLDQVRPLPASARVGGSGVLRFLNPKVALTLRDYAMLMISVNDNTAANFLTDLVGMANVNTSLAAQGTPEIKFQRKAISRQNAPANTPENIGTPRAVLRSLELLHRGAVVDRATSDAIIELLALPEVSYYRRGLPPSIRFAGRSGSGPKFRCDAGLVLLRDRPYIFCVMIDGLAAPAPGAARRDSTIADELISKLSRLAYAHFTAGPPPTGDLP